MRHVNAWRPGPVGGDRRGTALLAVLAVLAVVTVAATAAAALSRTQQHDARGAAAGLRARAAAEGALAGVLTSWPGAWTTRLVPGGWDARLAASAAGPATVRALRLDAHRYLLTAESSSPAFSGPLGAAVRRIALFAQLDNVAYTPGATLVAAGPVAVGLDAEIRGADAAPLGWTDCTGFDTASVAVAAPSVGVAPTARVVGSVVTDPGAWSPPPAERFGDVDRAALVARADVVLPAGGAFSPLPRTIVGATPADTGCVRDAASWGEPYRGPAAVAACAGDLPVVYVRGPGVTELRGPARLQGTLVVDGALTVTGRVEVAGLVVVGGRLDASAGALVVDGAVLVRGGAASVGPGSRVRRSRCALERAAAGASRPVPLARRAWSDVVR